MIQGLQEWPIMQNPGDRALSIIW